MDGFPRRLGMHEPITLEYAVAFLDGAYRAHGGPDARHRPDTLAWAIIASAERTVRGMAHTASDREIDSARAHRLARTCRVVDSALRTAGREIH